MAARLILFGEGERLARQMRQPVRHGNQDACSANLPVAPGLIDSIREMRCQLRAAPAHALVGGEGVFEARLQPALRDAASLTLDSLRRAGLREIGSRMAPLPDGVAALTIFVAGGEQAICRWEALLEAGGHPARHAIAHVHWPTAGDKIRGEMPTAGQTGNFELVLHAGDGDAGTVEALQALCRQRGVQPDPERQICAGGLTFLRIAATTAQVLAVAEFSFLRLVRRGQALQAVVPPLPRRTLRKLALPPQAAPPPGPCERAAIFDGGLGVADLGPWVREHVYPETAATARAFLVHGTEVTSAFLFGPEGRDAAFRQPVMGVDHYRVLTPDSFKDPDLFDVLLRIKGELETGRHRFANISLGPRMPVRGDEVHVWTAVLEQTCARHDILLTVAAGNDGEAGGDCGIQPPGDMANAITVGACDRSGPAWQRAPYSCRGPGRAPGPVKPDGLAFGGSRQELLALYSPFMRAVAGVAGTSYAAPQVLRSAAELAVRVADRLSALVLKTLLIHHAAPHPDGAMDETGWGRFRENAMDMLACAPDSVTVVFRAAIAAGESWRFAMPCLQAETLCVTASFCASVTMGPEHVTERACPGAEVSFRPRAGRGDMRSQPFFAGDGLANDAVETAPERGLVLHRQRRLEGMALDRPVFDVGYWAGMAADCRPAGAAPVLDCVLAVSLQAPGVVNFYDLIRSRHPGLEPINLRAGSAAE